MNIVFLAVTVMVCVLIFSHLFYFFFVTVKTAQSLYLGDNEVSLNWTLPFPMLWLNQPFLSLPSFLLIQLSLIYFQLKPSGTSTSQGQWRHVHNMPQLHCPISSIIITFTIIPVKKLAHCLMAHCPTPFFRSGTSLTYLLSFKCSCRRQWYHLWWPNSSHTVQKPV